MTAITNSPTAFGLHFPTSLVFDEDGTGYVAESGLPLGGAPKGGRVVRLGRDGECETLVAGLRPPVNGLAWDGAGLIIAEGGAPGRLSRWDRGSDSWAVVLDELPGGGDYHTSAPALSPDGSIYFSVGAQTNSGVVGPDRTDLAWLDGIGPMHDVPGFDVVVRDRTFHSVGPGPSETTHATGAFAPFGTSHSHARTLRGRVPCTAAVMRCAPDGSDLTLVAWGLRNAFGLRFLRDGRLFATEQAPDDRGSRPLGTAPDMLFEVREGAWYGWPDFVGGVPVTDPALRSSRGPAPEFLLANHAELPPPERPFVRLDPNTCPTKLAEAHASRALVVALFGDEKPIAAPDDGRPVGRGLVQVDLSSRAVAPIAAEPLCRPIDVAFDPCDGRLFALDFGEFEMGPAGQVSAKPGTGRVVEVPLELG